jgi:hypothetical protein
MAKNLRLKIPKDDTLFIQDVNTSATKKFVEELAAYQVTIASSARELSEKSVSTCFLLTLFSMMIFKRFHL